ncbi:MAG: Uma2 family endonuclease [Planctomycetes bacterium]|nr:Uma2 family endonuclease [Planctomycetota bacterium]
MIAQNPQPQPTLTIEEFEERLAEGDRWIELVNGHLMRFEPPDEIHGDVVRNLSRALARYLKKITGVSVSFELPLIISRASNTIRCPAVSCFRTSNRFDETDKLVSDSCPELVIEVASTNQRRRSMTERVVSYFDTGIQEIWIIDPIDRNVHQFRPGSPGTILDETEILSSENLLPEFEVSVADLFSPPKWAAQKDEGN